MPFAVYDGHGGSDVSQFCANELHTTFIRKEALSGDMEDSITTSFLRVDEMLSQGLGNRWSGMKGSDAIPVGSGSTGCVVLLRDREIIIANAGDCRCIVFSQNNIHLESTDHIPENEMESARVYRAGGYINDGYVNDRLNITRSFGDFDLKGNDNLLAEDQIITDKPQLITAKLPEEAEFIILACDGIWDVMTSEEVMKFVHEHINSEDKLSGVCEKLMDSCLAPKVTDDEIGCDNMSVILIQLKNPMDQHELSTPNEDVMTSLDKENFGLLEYYKSRCSQAITAELVGRLEAKYVFCKDMKRNDLEALIDGLLLPQENNADGHTFRLLSTGKNQFAFDEDLQQICRCRGEGKTYECSGDKAEVIAVVLYIVRGLLRDNRMLTTRGVYYRKIIFKSQRQVDEALISISLMLGVTRSSLHVFGSSRGLIIGPIVLIGPEFSIDCQNCGILGTIVPIESGTISDIQLKPDVDHVSFILVVEKETAFAELASLKFPRKYNCILITARGQPDLATRALLSKLQKFFDVPIFAVVDPNPSGLEIYCTYKYGSKRMAHENLGYSVPKLEWAVIYPSHLHGIIDEAHHMKLTAADIKTAKRLLKKEYVDEDQRLKKELMFMLQNNVKGEIECTSSVATDFIMHLVGNMIEEIMASRVTGGEV
ncbi:unnamed protein product [Urochloa humidicola]